MKAAMKIEVSTTCGEVIQVEVSRVSEDQVACSMNEEWSPER